MTMLYFAVFCAIVFRRAAAELFHSINTSMPFRNMSEIDLVHLIQRTTTDLRLFIYPIPSSAMAAHGSNGLPHFSMEKVFAQYLRNQVNTSAIGAVVVNDPSTANAFLIEQHHTNLQIGLQNCAYVLKEHLLPILDNVINNYPYFNRSKGADHFYFSVYDKGEICSDWCTPQDQALYLPKLENVSLIGNYGMDRASFKQGEKICFRPEQDIVIPQPVEFQPFFDHLNHPKLFREFDATFAGSLWGDRDPYLDVMGRSALFDYENEGTEDFGFDISGGSPDKELLHKGYFMYDPCGMACWSMRLYEAIVSRTIPIISGDGIIQPFEKFIDWSKISVKMSTDTWHNTSKRNLYRKQIRIAADEFRASLHADLKNISISKPVNPIEWGKIERMKRLAHEIPSWMDGNYTRLSQTTVYKKMAAITAAARWFDLKTAESGSDNHPGNAFQLLLVEMWCRVFKVNITGGFHGNIHPNCLYPSDATARIEYF